MSNQFQKPLHELIDQTGSLNAVVLRRVFLVLVRSHFSNPRNYTTPDLKDLYYDDTVDSPLDIKLDFTYDSEDIGKKPVIYVGTGPFQFKNQVIDDYAGTSYDNSITGNTAQCITTVEIKSISMSADLSLALADQALNLLGAAKFMMQQELPSILDYSVSSMTPPTLIDPEKIKVFQSNITLNLAFNITWVTVLESLRIKNIVFDSNNQSSIVNDLDM